MLRREGAPDNCSTASKTRKGRPMTPATAFAPRRARSIALVKADQAAPASRSKVTALPTQCGTCNLREVCLPCGIAELLGNPDYTRRRVKRGDTLFHAGAHFDSLYAGRSGFFKSSVVLAGGRDQGTGFHMAGGGARAGGSGQRTPTPRPAPSRE